MKRFIGLCLKHITELENENTELKVTNKNLLDSCEGATMMYKDLCEATEIIKELLDFDFLPEVDIKKRAEQFISRGVKVHKDANEWHFVKNGDLPRQDGHTCFSIKVLANNKKWVYYRFDSNKWFCGNKEVKVTAWREIIFPKLNGIL